MLQFLRINASKLINLKALYIILLFAMLLTFTQLTAQDKITQHLSLDQCIELGLKNNPGFQSSEFLVKETKAKIEEAFSGYYPFVSINSDADAYSKDNGSQRYDNFNTGVHYHITYFRDIRRNHYMVPHRIITRQIYISMK